MASAVTSTRRAAPPARRVGRATLVALIGLALAVAAACAVATVALIRHDGVDGTGVPVPIPGGEVTVQSVAHVAAAGGRTLPSGSHAVEVLLTVSTSGDETLPANPRDFVIEGIGINRPLRPIVATPASAVALAGQSADLRLDYVVPDESTQLVLVLPGGARVTAQHADHPGDRTP